MTFLIRSVLHRHARYGTAIGTLWVLFIGVALSGRADDSVLSLSDLAAFREPKANWVICGDVKLDPKNRRQLATGPGQGILVSHGKGVNLCTEKSYRDCQVEVEFMIPQGSNSGVKLNGCYEIQIFDSWKKKKVTGSDCGGIYPRGEYSPHYHTIDDGTPPKVNACRCRASGKGSRSLFRAPALTPKARRLPTPSSFALNLTAS